MGATASTLLVSVFRSAENVRQRTPHLGIADQAAEVDRLSFHGIHLATFRPLLRGDGKPIPSVGLGAFAEDEERLTFGRESPFPVRGQLALCSVGARDENSLGLPFRSGN